MRQSDHISFVANLLGQVSDRIPQQAFMGKDTMVQVRDLLSDADEYLAMNCTMSSVGLLCRALESVHEWLSDQIVANKAVEGSYLTGWVRCVLFQVRYLGE